jgi:hypothetical protein
MVLGKQYSMEDIQIILFGKKVTAITNVEYGHKQDKKFQRGTGTKPISFTNGEYNGTGEITMLQSEFEALQRSFPKGKSITDAPPSDITCSYGMEGDTKPVTDIVKNCLFTEVKKAMKNDNGHMEVKLPFICSEVVYNS